MKTAIKIDLEKRIVTFGDGSEKTLDNYVLELEDRLIKLHEILKDYEDADPNNEYLVEGEVLFNAMDVLEGK